MFFYSHLDARHEWEFYYMDYDLTTRKGRNSFYNTEEWRNLREYKFYLNPFCERCENKGKLVPATECHHKIDLQDDPTLCLSIPNLESLCHHCHSSHTLKQTIAKQTLIKRNHQPFIPKWKSLRASPPSP